MFLGVFMLQEALFTSTPPIIKAELLAVPGPPRQIVRPFKIHGVSVLFINDVYKSIENQHMIYNVFISIINTLFLERAFYEFGRLLFPIFI